MGIVGRRGKVLDSNRGQRPGVVLYRVLRAYVSSGCLLRAEC